MRKIWQSRSTDVQMWLPCLWLPISCPLALCLEMQHAWSSLVPSGQYLHTSTSQYIIPGPGRHLAQFDLQIRPRPAVMAPRSPLRPVENWIISYFVIIKVPDPPWPRWCWLFSHACSAGLLLLQLRSRQGDLQSFMTRNKKLMHPT